MEGLLVAWDDAVADGAFAMNMDLDEPRELRRAAVEKVAADLGPFRPDATRPEVSESPAHLTWWLRGERGWVRLGLLVTPEPSPRVQRFAVTAVPDPSDALLGHRGQDPRRRRVAVAGLARRRRRPAQTSIWSRSNGRCGPPRHASGPMRRGLPMAGDGTTTATFQVDGDDGRAELKITVDPESGAVTTVVLSAAEREAAAEAW